MNVLDNNIVNTSHAQSLAVQRRAVLANERFVRLDVDGRACSRIDRHRVHAIARASVQHIEYGLAALVWRAGIRVARLFGMSSFAAAEVECSRNHNDLGTVGCEIGLQFGNGLGVHWSCVATTDCVFSKSHWRASDDGRNGRRAEAGEVGQNGDSES